MGRSKVVKALSAVALVAGLVLAVGLWTGAGKRYDNAVADMAPAFVGCDTTLEFDRTGTYTFFVETSGEVDEVDGDCATDSFDYAVDAEDAPRVTLTLVDSDGEEVDLDRASGPTYDRGGRVGTAVRTAEITSTGEYVLTATAADDVVVVRVGRDPSSGVTPMRIGSILALLIGAGVMAAILAATRAPRQAATAPTVQGPAWPYGPQPAPPLGPPSAHVPVTPPYAAGPGTPPASPPGTAPTSPAGWSGASPTGWSDGGRPLPPPPPPPAPPGR